MSQYRQGTVDVTNGSTTVTGNDTRFLINVDVGNGFIVDGHPVVYTVAAVNSDTEVVLETQYQGVTEAEAIYAIHTGFTSIFNLPEISQGDIETGVLLTRLARKVEQALNSTIDASALAGAGIFPNTAAGLAATSDGEYFYVIDDDEMVLYLNDTGSAVEQLRFASLSLVQQLSAQLSTAVDDAQAFALNAETSAGEAADSATNAELAEISALGSASDAEGSAETATIQAAASGASAADSATSASAALTERLSAEDAAAIAMSIANFRGRWGDLTGSLSVPAAVFHDGKYWQLLEDIADVTAEEPPSTVWADIAVQLTSGLGTAINFTASATFTLPDDSAAGAIFIFTKISGVTPTIETDGVQNIVTSSGNTFEIEFDVMREVLCIFDGTDWHLTDG